MTTLRMLVLMLLVVIITSSPITVSTAQASGFDEVNRFAHYLCQYYLGCEEEYEE